MDSRFCGNDGTEKEGYRWASRSNIIKPKIGTFPPINLTDGEQLAFTDALAGLEPVA